ncbi:Tetratricopeptide repeat [Rhabdaerophilaceae bacterium]
MNRSNSVSALLLACALLMLAGGTPSAQTPPTNPDAPAQRRESEKERLDRLFERLKNAPTPEAANPITRQIEQRFERSGSETADLLLQRAKQAIEAKNFESALDLLDYIVTLRPDWAEAYHRRAIVHFLNKDEDSAMRDIRMTLAQEPRHFQALAGLGRLLQMMGKRKPAFEVYQQVLAIHPHFPEIKGMIDRLKPAAEGQPI